MTAPDLNLKIGPVGPSDVVTGDILSLVMVKNISRSALAPVLVDDPRITVAPRAETIFAGISPSTEGLTKKPDLHTSFDLLQHIPATKQMLLVPITGNNGALICMHLFHIFLADNLDPTGEPNDFYDRQY
jgi:hypothetical protein